MDQRIRRWVRDKELWSRHKIIILGVCGDRKYLFYPLKTKKIP